MCVCVYVCRYKNVLILHINLKDLCPINSKYTSSEKNKERGNKNMINSTTTGFK